MLSDRRSNEDVADATTLVSALQRVRDAEKRSNVRSTNHYVSLSHGDASGSTAASAIVQEAADEDDEAVHSIAKLSLQPVQKSTSSAQDGVTLTSWKTQEFAYRKTTKVGVQQSDELPTLARGLFTTPIGSDEKQHRIVVRGYDKFFNQGEMPWTKPAAIAAFSCPPYELSFKENGCIIFISALTPTQLIVTSKHSLGSNESHTVSHAQKGEEWLDEHLASKGKSKQALAAELWRRNETAVAELCDDKFEEHVLAYPAERSGLHLHGLNANAAHFKTRAMAEVESFAHEWGFLPTRFILFDSLQDVDKFCKSVAESGSWQGIAIEGFVVRTRMPASLPEASGTVSSDGTTPTVAPPYQPGQTWFYKVKFEEPYLMYRDWRELTKRMLTDHEKYSKANNDRETHVADMPSPTTELDSMTDKEQSKSKGAKKKEAKKAEHAKRLHEAALGIALLPPPTSRSNRPETKLFIQWCYEKLYGSKDGKVKGDPATFAGFQRNQGIIRLREDFIAYMSTDEGRGKLDNLTRAKSGKDGDAVMNDNTSDSEKSFDKTLIVPIAVPGCGKTMLALALRALIPDFGHTQSDDVKSKKTAATFLANVMKELELHSVVFADRNNHLFKHRDEIVQSVQDWQSSESGKTHRVRLVALAWSLDALPHNAIHRLCAERIVKRGDNHQTIRVTENADYGKILWRFLKSMEPFDSAMRGDGDKGHGDGVFDMVIKLDVNASLERNVLRTYEQLTGVLNLSALPHDKLRAALDQASLYKVTIKKEIKEKAPASVRYYGLAVEIDLVAVLLELLKPYPMARLALRKLQETQRIVIKPHVTLVHYNEVRAGQPMASVTEKHSGAGIGGGGEDGGSEEVTGAKERWQVFSDLAASGSPTVFDMSSDLIAWDDKAMALGIHDVHCAELPSLDTMQGAHWRPHITVGTFSESIRPFEANRVLRDADAQRTNVRCIRFAEPLKLQGVVRGMT